MARFLAWLEEAQAAGIRFPEAAALATADADGRPAVRHVLLKGFDERGFVFFTNRDSRKGQHLATNPHAALAFYWRELDRQVCVAGAAERDRGRGVRSRTSRTRPREARIGAWASHAEPVASARARSSTRAYAELEARYPDDDVPLVRRTGAATGSIPTRSSSGRAASTGCTTASATRARTSRLAARATCWP